MVLGSGFSQLHNLSELLFSKGKVRCAILVDKIFENIENISLKYLDMSSVEFTEIRGYWNFRHLETLKLNNNHFFNNGMPSIFSYIGILKMPNLKHLYLHNVLLACHDFNRIVTYVHESKLRTLEVDRNHITKMLVLFHLHMPNLEKLSLAENLLPSSMELLWDILSLTHLKDVNLSGQNRIWSDDTHQRYRRYYTLTAEQPNICFIESHRACSFSVPENLTSLDLSSSFPGPVIPELVLMNNNTLRLVNLSFNAIQHLPKPFYCAANTKPAISVLDLSNNKIECITSSFFTQCDWSSLNIFKLNQNKLTQTTVGDCNKN